MITPDLLDAAGEALYGPRWKSELARALGVTSRTVRRWSDGEWPVSERAARDLIPLLTERAEKIEKSANAVKKALDAPRR